MNSALFARSNGVCQYTDATLDFTNPSLLGLLLTPGGNGLIANTSATVPATMVCLDANPPGIANAVATIGGVVAPVRIVAAGAISQFQRVVQDAGGGVHADPGPGTARVAVGVALEAATAAGQYIIVQLMEPVIAS